MHLNVNMAGEIKTIQVDATDRVKRLQQKLRVTENLKESAVIKVIFKGKQLESHWSVFESGLKDGCTLHAVVVDSDGLIEVGHRCSMNGCNHMDFLPFKCQHCRKKFCSDHFSYKEHNCPCAPHVTVAIPSSTKSKAKRCVECRKKQMVPYYCNSCGSCVCMSHRYEAQHHCRDRRAQNALRHIDPHNNRTATCSA